MEGSNPLRRDAMAIASFNVQAMPKKPAAIAIGHNCTTTWQTTPKPPSFTMLMNMQRHKITVTFKLAERSSNADELLSESEEFKKFVASNTLMEKLNDSLKLSLI